MSWAPEDDDPPPTSKPRGYYRNSTSMCDCDMCSADGADETELDQEDYQ